VVRLSRLPGPIDWTMLRLTEHVPARLIYLTSRRSRTITAGPITIELRHRASRKLTSPTTMSTMVFSALRDIGKTNITPERTGHLRGLPSPPTSFDRRLGEAPDPLHAHPFSSPHHFLWGTEASKTFWVSLKHEADHGGLAVRFDDLMEAVREEEEGKPSIPVRAWPTWGGVRLPEAEYLVGSPEILLLMRRAGWIHAVVQGKRLTLFDRSQLQKAWERLVRVGIDHLRNEARRISPLRRGDG